MPSFSNLQWSEICKEFGLHCVRHRDLRKAKNYFEESIHFDNRKLDSVFLLTNTQAKEAILDEALKLLNQISVSYQGLLKSIYFSRERECPQCRHISDKYENHFKCNLQECDSNYEGNDFEKSLLLLVRKAQKLENEVTIIPKATSDFNRKQADAKLKGPKIGALRQRSEMVHL